MTLLTIAWRYLQGRFVTSLLTTIAIGLGVGLIVATVLLTGGIKEGFIEGATEYSLIVGAKGSPTQLVLNVVFRMDAAPPNIPFATYQQLQRDPRVEVAVPVAMGDAYEGFRYVATTEAYFAPFPWRRRALALSAGRPFRSDAPARPAYEAVLGADVARRTRLALGDRFYDGEDMAEYPLTVVGVLRAAGTADDRAIFISLPSYWQMNELARTAAVKPLTAVLVRPKRLSDLPALHRGWNLEPETQAALPSVVLLNIFNLLGLVQEVLAVVLGVVVVVVALYLFVTMYNAAWERRREIATMRALGARRVTILAIVLLESCAIAALGGLAGILGGHGAAYLGAHLLAGRGGPVSPAFALSALQPLIFAAVVVLGALAGLLPAVLAYRTEVAENLAAL